MSANIIAALIILAAAWGIPAYFVIRDLLRRRSGPVFFVVERETKKVVYRTTDISKASTAMLFYQTTAPNKHYDIEGKTNR